MLLRQKLMNFDRLPALSVDRSSAISAAENETAAEIMFRHRSELHVDGLHDAAFPLPPAACACPALPPCPSDAEA